MDGEELDLEFKVCERCQNTYYEGTVYCFGCWALLPGRRHRNIYRESSESTTRGENSFMSVVYRGIQLVVTKNSGKDRRYMQKGIILNEPGYTDDLHDWQTLCKEYYKKTLKPVKFSTDDGSGVSTAYPCKCGTATCTDNQQCTARPTPSSDGLAGTFSVVVSPMQQCC